MSHTSKIVNNTASSYLRIIINGIVTLLVTRIALARLGVNDFGLYNLLAGTIALLSFVNSALLVSSQRYFSIALGAKDLDLLNKYYFNSVIIHIFLSIIVAVVLLILQPILFKFLLNIDPSQETIAQVIYQIMIISTCITLLCVPFAALMNSYEDIARLSFINIGSYFIRLLAAIVLLFFDNHLLLIYTTLILSSIAFKLICEITWCKRKYKEIKIYSKSNFDKQIIKEMSGFTGWNTIGSFSVLIRDEGVALVLNHFFGTAINAAYGVANQVNSLVLSFAASLTTVFTPSIIQARGAGENDRMRYLAIFASKLSFLLSSLMALPILVFLHPILSIWLKAIPEYTEIFCRYIIYCFLIQMLYSGINRMIYATGKIKYYQISMFIAFISIIPSGILLFNLYHQPPSSLLITMIISQFVVLIISLFIAQKECNLNLKKFLWEGVSIPVCIFITSLLITKFIFNNLESDLLLIMLYAIIIDIIFFSIYFILVFNKNEKKQFYKILPFIKKTNDKKID